jgi:hypothetical protein
MTFATPLALFGLLSLPVIFGLHMMRSRSRRLTVSSLGLWSFLDPQVRGARARRIPLTWLLLLDLLIAALLSLALANPQLELTRRGEAARHTIILLDISTSMAAGDEPGSRLQAAVSEIEGLLQSGADQEIFTLITFGRTAQTLGDSRSDDRSRLLSRLAGLSAGGAGSDLQAALALAQASVDTALPAQLHIFSDAAFPQPAIPANMPPRTWHILGRSGNNQAVLSLAAERLSEGKFQVFARFANFDERQAVRRATLYAGGTAVASADLALAPGTAQVQSWDVVGKPDFVQVVLEGADDMPLDDRASLGFPTGRRLSAALVAAQPGAMLQALRAQPGLDLAQVAPDDYLPGSPYDLVVFSGFLPENWPAGHVIVSDPPADSSLLGPASLAPIEALPFPRPDPLLEEVDFTGLRWGLAWRLSGLPPGRVVLAADRQPLIVRTALEGAHVTLLLPEITRPDGSPTPFARHPAFPIIIANALELAGGAAFPGQLSLGSPLELPAPGQAASLTVQPPAGEPVRFGAQHPAEWAGATAPGLYRVSLTDPNGLALAYLVGVNAGDLAESDISPGRFATSEGLAAAGTVETQQPVSLASWLLGLAGLLLLLEAWLAWR